jgi:hypothetical protein
MEMTNQKLGNNPFGGVNELVRNTQNAHSALTAQDAYCTHTAQYTHKTQKLERINLALPAESLEYVRIMSGVNAISATKYINQLILEDMEKRKDSFEKLKALVKINSVAKRTRA